MYHKTACQQFSKDILHAMMPCVEVYEADLHEGIRIMTKYALAMACIALAGPFLTQSPPPTELDGNQALKFYWIDPIEAADHMVARPELADHFYFHYEWQVSEHVPKRFFDGVTLKI